MRIFNFIYLQNCGPAAYLRDRLQQLTRDNDKFSPITGNLQ